MLCRRSRVTLIRRSDRLTVVAADERVMSNREVSRPSILLPAARHYLFALMLESLAAELGR